MTTRTSLLFLLVGLSLSQALVIEREPRINFANYHVIQVKPATQENLEILQEMEATADEATAGAVEFWTGPIDAEGQSTLSVHPDLVEPVTAFFEMKNMSYEVLVENLQSLIDEETAALLDDEDEGLTFRDPSKSYFKDNKYNRLNQISMHLKELQQQNPQLMNIRSIGTTFEGRAIEMAVLSQGSSRPVVLLECGIHAREWVSPAFCMYTLKRVLREGNSGILGSFDMYIIPNANPDGYEYSHNSNRMWRKNRRVTRRTRNTQQDSNLSPETKQFWQQFPGYPGQQQFGGWQQGASNQWAGFGSQKRPASPGVDDKCKGVDPNRNFDVAFGGAGTSGNDCEDIYRGTHGFSEAESSAIRDVILQTQSSGRKIATYISVHAYSQYWMFPYGYTKSRAKDYNDLKTISKIAVDSLSQSYGTRFTYGPINEVIYKAAGSSVDWAYDKGGVKYSFALELRDKGRYGFILPPAQIEPTCVETFAGLQALVNELKNRPY